MCSHNCVCAVSHAKRPIRARVIHIPQNYILKNNVVTCQNVAVPEIKLTGLFLLTMLLMQFKYRAIYLVNTVEAKLVRSRRPFELKKAKKILNQKGILN